APLAWEDTEWDKALLLAGQQAVPLRYAPARPVLVPNALQRLALATFPLARIRPPRVRSILDVQPQQLRRPDGLRISFLAHRGRDQPVAPTKRRIDVRDPLLRLRYKPRLGYRQRLCRGVDHFGHEVVRRSPRLGGDVFDGLF